MSTDMDPNPYRPPSAVVADETASVVQEFQPVATWSARGRIGRLRLMANYLGASLLSGTLSSVAVNLAGPRHAFTVAMVFNLAVLAFMMLKFIQRSHDMGWSGWTALITLIPLAGLVWLFKAGTPGPNAYGAPPPPNTLIVKIAGLFLPLVAVVGIVAAIALPAYVKYTGG